MQAAMAKRKRHSRVEIATKLAEANDLAMQGKRRKEIARTLGVSVMTLHRWRKALLGVHAAVVAPPTRASPIARAGPTTRLPNSSSKICGCDGW
jgi:putative transposase